MLSQITWHQWWLFIAAATAIYYLLITVLFFRKDLVRRLPVRERAPGIFPGQLPENEDMENEAEETAEPQSPEEEKMQDEEEQKNIAATNEQTTEAEEVAVAENIAFMDTISEAISQCLSLYKGYANKEEVIQKLAHLLAQYKDAGAYELYEEAIDWHMNEQVRLYCGASLSDNDLRRIRDIAGSLS